jgi:hypothetical protein
VSADAESTFLLKGPQLTAAFGNHLQVNPIPQRARLESEFQTNELDGVLDRACLTLEFALDSNECHLAFILYYAYIFSHKDIHAGSRKAARLAKRGPVK